MGGDLGTEFENLPLDRVNLDGGRSVRRENPIGLNSPSLRQPMAVVPTILPAKRIRIFNSSSVFRTANHGEEIAGFSAMLRTVG
jgi:hypothetical protein